MTKEKTSLTIDNPKFFFDALQTIEEIDYECVMRISDTGCRVTGIDPSRIAMFEFQYGEVGETLPIGIQMTDLSKIISRIKSTKSITIEAQTDKFKIITDLKGTKKTFMLRCIDIDAMENLPFDSLLGLPFQKKIKIDTGELINSLKDIELISETVTIGFRDNKLVYRGSSPSGEIELETEGYESADFSSSYSLPLILSKMKGMIGYKASMFIGVDLPLFFNYESEEGYLRIFIAPRVETDEL